MWQYINHDEEGEPISDPKFPAEGTVFRGYDAFRGKEVIAYRELGIGCVSILNPNVSDDCHIIAFAPLDEPTSPDAEKLKAAWSLPPCYPHACTPKLVLGHQKTA